MWVNVVGKSIYYTVIHSNWDLLFSWWFFTAWDPMGFITLFYHHLKNYFWNFLQEVQETCKSKKKGTISKGEDSLPTTIFSDMRQFLGEYVPCTSCLVDDGDPLKCFRQVSPHITGLVVHPQQIQKLTHVWKSPRCPEAQSVPRRGRDFAFLAKLGFGGDGGGIVSCQIGVTSPTVLGGSSRLVSS